MERTLTAFAGDLWIATGDDGEVREALRAMGDDAQAVLLFDDATGRQVDIDLRGPAVDAPRGRGRPKLGVQSREITLLPRHWDWLATQPGGASATVRRLVEAARKADTEQPSPRAAMDAAYHFMTAMAGDRPGYEAAIRALFAKDAQLFNSLSQDWPSGIRDHARALAGPAFAQQVC
ncbi:DUF2239 family protein [Sphingomonas bisphenolicum]|uniref:DUF2239 domain-containing protein n=1 Tax=Sphingomonas bisphenolicum TaxID=296544 RepID=A0ABM7G2J4_9SPHN|nr:DUF2239 family protein [Sphingomonas bisphenolicum]BBF69439.1 hypothetical protein SBA_ch1_16390 [Sphingomonas bisphenolicum]